MDTPHHRDFDDAVAAVLSTTGRRPTLAAVARQRLFVAFGHARASEILEQAGRTLLALPLSETHTQFDEWATRPAILKAAAERRAAWEERDRRTPASWEDVGGDAENPTPRAPASPAERQPPVRPGPEPSGVFARLREALRGLR